MNAPEGLDIRAPIGGLFTVLGAMLAGYGLFTSGTSAASGLASSANVNLWWGLVMLAFGVVLLLMARRSMSRPRPAETR
jgi:membrane protein implicated in regulation of membrane protease activity